MTRTSRTCLFMFCLFFFFLSASFLWGFFLSDIALSPLMQQCLLSTVVFVLPCLIYFMITAEPIQNTLRLHAIRPVHLLAAVLLGFSVQPFMSLLALLSSFFFPNQVAESMQTLTQGSFLAGLVTIAVLPAVFEEVCFRGIIFSGMARQSLLKACLATGFLFALMHLDPQQFLYTFAMGGLFAFMVYQTNSLFSSIIAHFVFNGSQFVLAWLAEKSLQHVQDAPAALLPPLQELALAFLILFIEMLFFLPLLVLGLWILMKYPPAKKPDPLSYHPSPTVRESLFNVPVVLTVVLYGIFGILPYIVQFISSLFYMPI